MLLSTTFRDVLPKRFLVVDDEHGAFRVSDGETVDLRTSARLRRIFHRLVDVHCQTAGCAVAIEELFDAGWPEEAMDDASPEGQRELVTDAIASLRGRGLASVIADGEHGFRIDPRVCVIAECMLRSPATEHPVFRGLARFAA